MSRSFQLDPPIRTYRITLGANETRVVGHGEAAAFFLPVQGGVVTAGSLRVAFGQNRDEVPVTEGIFISAPGVNGWNETKFRNTTGSTLTFEYVLASDPSVVIIHGV